MFERVCASAMQCMLLLEGPGKQMHAFKGTRHVMCKCMFCVWTQDASEPTHNPFNNLCVLDYIRPQEPPDCFTDNSRRLISISFNTSSISVSLKLLHYIFSSVFSSFGA